ASGTVAVFECIVVVAVLTAGPGAPGTGVAFAIPMTIAALVLGRPGLIVTTAISIGTIVVYQATPGHPVLSAPVAINLTISLGILGVVLDRFGVSLRDALAGEVRHRDQLTAARIEVGRKATLLDESNRDLQRAMIQREA